MGEDWDEKALGWERIGSCRREWESNQSQVKSCGVGTATHKVPFLLGTLFQRGRPLQVWKGPQAVPGEAEEGEDAQLGILPS